MMTLSLSHTRRRRLKSENSRADADASSMNNIFFSSALANLWFNFFRCFSLIRAHTPNVENDLVRYIRERCTQHCDIENAAKCALIDLSPR